MPAQSTPSSAGTDYRTGHAYRVLRHRDYRLLWSCDAVSTAGTQIQRIAVAWQVFRLTDDPFHLGLLGLCRFFPVILFSLIGGVAADRWDRRRTLLIAQLLLLACSGALALMTWTDTISIYAIYAVVVLSGIFDSVSWPTRQALLPALVPREELPAASTMNLIDGQVATIGGPAIGGLLIGWLGVGSAYLVDAVSFGAVIFAILAMHARPEVRVTKKGGLAAAIEGLTFLRRSPVLLGVMVTDSLSVFFGISASLMPIFAEKILHVGPHGLGLLYSAPAVGGVIIAGILSVARLPDRAGLTIMAAIAFYGCCMFGFGLSRELWLSLLFLAGAGAADTVSMTLRHSMRNLITPNELLGRVSAVHTMLAGGGPQLGDFESGLLASLVGAGPATAIGGCLAILTAVAANKFVPQIGRFRYSRATQPPAGEPPLHVPVVRAAREAATAD